MRLLGVHASSFEEAHEQMDLLDEGKHERWQQALGGRRPAARQVWRFGGVAGGRLEGRRSASACRRTPPVCRVRRLPKIFKYC